MGRLYDNQSVLLGGEALVAVEIPVATLYGGFNSIENATLTKAQTRLFFVVNQINQANHGSDFVAIYLCINE
jgi:hypothetical protein